MTLISRLAAARVGLPPARTPRVGVEHDVEIPMPDGVRLLADRYHPRDEPRAPLVLVRLPYPPRAGYPTMARLVAERGYQVLLQSLRGTFGSGGRFDGYTLHPGDAEATVAWLRAQPWFPGSFATWGASFMAYAEWEMARTTIPEWRAAIVQDGPSELYHSFMYPGGAFALGNALGWLQVAHVASERTASTLAMTLGSLGAPGRLYRAARHLPLLDADRIAAGRAFDYYRSWVAHEEPDATWAAMDHRGNGIRMPAHVLLCCGWYDFFLKGMLEDWAALRRAGWHVRLVIGPWMHGAGLATGVLGREVLSWLDAHLRGETVEPPEHPVLLFVTGAERWSEFEDWPPAGYPEVAWHLQPERVLAPDPPPASPPDRYRYDPADPTPGVGGTEVGLGAGPRDNRRLEARPDVLTYTGAPLERPLEVIGPVTATVYVRSDREHTDVFVRLCDVRPGGASRNVCDGIRRLLPGRPEGDGEGVKRVTVELWPIAHRFLPGHRVRIQVSSGAHPRFARNPGTGEPLATAVATVPAQQEIFHDPEHPSAICLRCSEEREGTVDLLRRRVQVR